MRESLPNRRSVLRAVVAGAGMAALGACSADPYQRATPTGGATTGAGPSGSAGRVVEFQGVTYRVPQQAERIVTIGDVCLQPALDVGAPVVATSSIAPATVPPTRRAALRELPVLGSGRVSEPVTAAQVLEHRPDLVLVYEGTPQDLVDAVGREVPVVVVQAGGDQRFAWQERVRGIGEVAGVADPGAPEAALHAHVEQVRRERADVLALTQLVVLRAWDTKRISAYGADSVPGRLLAAAGVRFVSSVSTPEAVAAQGEVRAALTDVTTYLKDADIVMLASDYAGGLDAFTGGSLATSDPVTGHVRRTGAVLQGAGPLLLTNYAQAHYMLDRLDEALASWSAENKDQQPTSSAAS